MLHEVLNNEGAREVARASANSNDQLTRNKKSEMVGCRKDGRAFKGRHSTVMIEVL